MRHVMKYGFFGLVLLFIFSGEPMLIVPLVFGVIVASILLQMAYARKIKKWETLLQRRSMRQVEFYDVLEDMKSIWWVPNHPKYWGQCKTIYFAALHSRDISYEQKRELFDVFDTLKLKGIPFPRDREKENRQHANDAF